MQFTKAPHPANFSFGTAFDPATNIATFGVRELRAEAQSYADGIARLRLTGPETWTAGQNLLDLLPPEGKPSKAGLTFASDGSLELRGEDGELRLTGRFGVGGEASMFTLDVPPTARFFGMGEKLLGAQELSGYRAHFYNTDVWSDFPAAQWGDGPTDPPYFSTPYVAVRLEDGWLGVLLHNPWPAFVETPGLDDSRVFVSWQKTLPFLVLGSTGGTPDLWTIQAPDLATLTQRLQKLVGTTPTPPLWSLGYHQSKWGYGGHADLMALDAEFARAEIPCDGLWLDLDYMRGYRIFTVDEAQFPNGVRPTADALARNGRRMVPIIDPGIKSEPGLALYDEAKAGGHLCLTPEGEPFVGLVWPGETVFPDFTEGGTRVWWAGHCEAFLKLGFGGAWVDMNDPSTGPVDPGMMLFRNGAEPHEANRNQYALGMQMATVKGFQSARPDERPFLLSRSGFVGSSRYGAIWTGDNLSNRFYLASSIPTAIGMSLSGLPFHGMDVGGFGGDCTPELMEDWIKLAFLFPFCRNHSNNGSRPQEPWAFGAGTLDVVRRYIRLRYKMLPYLYALWAAHETTGEPPLRPLLYAYDEPGLELADGQFLIGAELLQAPFVKEEKTRPVILPGDRPWCALDDGTWHDPGVLTVRRRRHGTPIFAREGALVAMQVGTPRTPACDLRAQTLHLFAPEGWSGEAETTLVADDGLSLGYRRGARTEARIRVVGAEGHLAVETETLASGYGELSMTLVLHSEPKSLRLGATTVEVQRESSRLTDKSVPVWSTQL